MAPREPREEEPSSATTIGIWIPIALVAAVIVGYLTFGTGSDREINQVQTQPTTNPAVTPPQTAPQTKNPAANEVKPESEQKPPPAAVTPKDTDPRVDSQNSN